ncbi:MAG: hypothetical protein ACFFBS_06895 [Promethearchaeota archaeon]
MKKGEVNPIARSYMQISRPGRCKLPSELTCGEIKVRKGIAVKHSRKLFV